MRTSRCLLSYFIFTLIIVSVIQVISVPLFGESSASFSTSVAGNASANATDTAINRTDIVGNGTVTGVSNSTDTLNDTQAINETVTGDTTYDDNTVSDDVAENNATEPAGDEHVEVDYDEESDPDPEEGVFRLKLELEFNGKEIFAQQSFVGEEIIDKEENPVEEENGNGMEGAGDVMYEHVEYRNEEGEKPVPQMKTMAPENVPAVNFGELGNSTAMGSNVGEANAAGGEQPQPALQEGGNVDNRMYQPYDPWYGYQQMKKK